MLTNKLIYIFLKIILLRCIELLKEKELYCKAILTAIKVRIEPSYIWEQLEQLKNCQMKQWNCKFKLYKEEAECPDPINVETIVIEDKIVNSKNYTDFLC